MPDVRARVLNAESRAARVVVLAGLLASAGRYRAGGLPTSVASSTDDIHFASCFAPATGTARLPDRRIGLSSCVLSPLSKDTCSCPPRVGPLLDSHASSVASVAG